MSAKRKPDAKPKSTSAARTRAYRERMRAQGLKPVTLWVWDMDNPAVRKRIEDDCRRLRNDPQEKAIMEELEAFEADLGIWD